MDQVLDATQLIRLNRDEILKIADRHGVHNVRVFGSVARGEAGPTSDVDFLVEAGPSTSSWFPGGLIVDLEALLGRRVEVVTERGLHPQLRDGVLKEAVRV
jgi:predicted nucleotidyltransferase